MTREACARRGPGMMSESKRRRQEGRRGKAVCRTAARRPTKRWRSHRSSLGIGYAGGVSSPSWPWGLYDEWLVPPEDLDLVRLDEGREGELAEQRHEEPSTPQNWLAKGDR